MSTMLTVPCELCGEPTIMLGTKRCDRCWELERRIQADPVLAHRILAALAAPAVEPRSSGEREAETPEDWLACNTGDCPHQTQAECAAWLHGYRSAERLQLPLLRQEPDAPTLEEIEGLWSINMYSEGRDGEGVSTPYVRLDDIRRLYRAALSRETP